MDPAGITRANASHIHSETSGVARYAAHG